MKTKTQHIEELIAAYCWFATPKQTRLLIYMIKTGYEQIAINLAALGDPEAIEYLALPSFPPPPAN